MTQRARPWSKTGPAFWTRGRRFQLMEMIEQGKTLPEIASAMNVTVYAITNARTKYRLPSHRDTLLSASKVASLLGKSNPRSVTPLIRRGVLPATWIGRRWMIHPDHLEAFLADERYWNLWDPSEMPDPRRRARFVAMRASAGVLTTAQVAELRCCTVSTVQRWVRDGWLRPITVNKGQGRFGHLFRRADVLALEPLPIGGQCRDDARTSWKRSVAA